MSGNRGTTELGSAWSVAMSSVRNLKRSLINSSRGIIYKSSGDDFAQAARKAAEELKNRINLFRKKKNNL